MKRKKKILILTDDRPWGHRSIAKAFYSYFSEQSKKGNDLEVYYREVKSLGGISDDFYMFYYRYFPKIGGLFYKLSNDNNKMAVTRLMDDISKKNLSRLKETINEVKPDLVISAYFLHSYGLAKWRQKTGQKFKLWTVVADPWTTYPVSIVPGVDLYLVYDREGIKLAEKMGVDRNKVVATGWWVRPEMYKKFDRQKMRVKLGFGDDRPVIFVGGGSLGTYALPKLLPILPFLKKKVGFIFNTGTDKLAFNLVENYIKLYRRMRKDEEVIIKNFGWIDNMAEVLSACDIVFGKAGPNFLFDVVATGKPFVSITHISGQEDGNVELIKKKKLGWVEEGNGEISKFLVKYLKDPKKYQKVYEKEIRAEAKFNQKSLAKVWEMVKKI